MQGSGPQRHFTSVCMKIRLTGVMLGISVTAVLKDLNFIRKFIMILLYRLLCMLQCTIIKKLGVMLHVTQDICAFFSAVISM